MAILFGDLDIVDGRDVQAAHRWTAQNDGASVDSLLLTALRDAHTVAFGTSVCTETDGAYLASIAPLTGHRWFAVAFLCSSVQVGVVGTQRVAGAARTVLFVALIWTLYESITIKRDRNAVARVTTSELVLGAREVALLDRLAFRLLRCSSRIDQNASASGVSTVVLRTVLTLAARRSWKLQVNSINSISNDWKLKVLFEWRHSMFQ